MGRGQGGGGRGGGNGGGTAADRLNAMAEQISASRNARADELEVRAGQLERQSLAFRRPGLTRNDVAQDVRLNIEAQRLRARARAIRRGEA